jgi:D-alanyl-D-alanine carboxypeptidase/D-alanyl-D-alanine-endopeptidase (penicillin-binding protein 4)
MMARMKKLSITVIFILCLGSLAQADLPAGSMAALAKRIDSIINQSSQKNVEFSVHIIKADTGETVYCHNETKPLIPASNMKVITTAASLEYLGPDFKYQTKVGLWHGLPAREDTARPVPSGVEGMAVPSLVIIASGDPLLGDKATDAKYGREDGWIFRDIAAVLKQNGITTIKDIIVDTGVFDDQRVHPNWPEKDLNRWYACEVSGLNYSDNCIEVTAENIGGKVSISIEPKTDFVKITNNITPITKGTSKVSSYRTLEPNKIIIKGECNKQAGPFDVAIERPAAFFGFILSEYLIKAGIEVQGRLTEKTLDNISNIKMLAQYDTPLSDCLARCNKNSLGLAAEALLKTIAAYHGHPGRGKNGSWAGGRDLISQYLLKLGISQEEFYIDDASGLSSQNKLSANAITKVLLNIYESENWAIYKDSLSAGGVDGTISKYFTEPKYKGKILGKTGYINKVKSFSGVCSTEKGDFLFSILANNANGKSRDAINDIAKAVIDSE